MRQTSTMARTWPTSIGNGAGRELLLLVPSALAALDLVILLALALALALVMAGVPNNAAASPMRSDHPHNAQFRVTATSLVRGRYR